MRRGSSEDNLRRKLHVEWLARSDAGSASVVANGRSGSPEVRGGKASTAARDGKIQAVEDVEHLRPKLKFDVFMQRGVLDQRCIHGRETRSVNRIARR